jgi:heptosyltransferase-3
MTMILKKLDSFRKMIMPKLTQNIGKSHFNKKVKGTKKIKINTILICLPNQRLGNLILLTPLLQDVIATFPDCKIDIIVKGNLANQIFIEYKNIHNIIILPRRPFEELLNYLNIFFSVRTKKYDLAINGAEGSSSGKILTHLSNAKYKVFGSLEAQSDIVTEDDYPHMAKNNVYNFRFYLNQMGYLTSADKVPSLDIKLTKSEIIKGKEILYNSVANSNKKTILIFTYATGTKCYSKDWWNSFYKKLKTSYSESYNILEILPMENVSQIDFKTTSFYSKNIREIASVIANAEIFIGADSGIMHLASASKTTTIGLFSVTKESKYTPYNNGSTSFNTNKKTTKDLINEIEKRLN